MKKNGVQLPDALQETIFRLEEEYSEHYDILNTEVTFCSGHEESGKIENFYRLEIKAVLKADHVEQLDYYQGVTRFCGEIAGDIGQTNDEQNRLYMDMISSRQSEIYTQLQEYIGKEQCLIFYIKESYPADREEEKEILFENVSDYISLEEMLPSGHEELQRIGYFAMESIQSEYAANLQNVQLEQAGTVYSVDSAVAYMTKYTSNPTSCNVCGAGHCNARVDTTKYNPQYHFHVSVGHHVDCANYVSQALHAGGIETDDTWKPESLAWVNVSKLTEYMTKNNHWKSIDYTQVKRGDIASHTSYSHVVMITSYDGVTYKFSSHTNDRKDAQIAINSKTASEYHFYRVS